MRHVLAFFIAALFTAAALPARTALYARSERRDNRSHARSERHAPERCPSCERDCSGKIKRSAAARRQFRNANPCPPTGKTSGECPGYEIDHRVPLYQGGADEPGNMRWLTTAEHRAKTARERRP